MSAVDLSTYGGALLEQGYDGQIVDLNEALIISRTNENATAIDFGGVVARGASDNTCKPLAAANDNILGLAVRHPVMVSATLPGATPSVKYAQYDSVPTLEIGRMYKTAGMNVTAGKGVRAKLSDGSLLDSSVAIGTAAAAAKQGGNTGNGTLTMDGSTPVLAGAKAGVYKVECIAAAANNGTFRVTDPDGFVLGDIVMAGGAGAFANDIKFALADGGVDFIVGDAFDVTVTETSVAVPGAVWDTTTTNGNIGVVRINKP